VPGTDKPFKSVAVHACGREFIFNVVYSDTDTYIMSQNWYRGERIRDLVLCIPELAEQARRIREELGIEPSRGKIVVQWLIPSKGRGVSRLVTSYEEVGNSAELYVAKNFIGPETRIEITLFAGSAGVSELSLKLSDEVHLKVSATGFGAISDAVKAMTGLVVEVGDLVIRKGAPLGTADAHIAITYNVKAVVDSGSISDVVIAGVETVRFTLKDMSSVAPIVSILGPVLSRMLIIWHSDKRGAMHVTLPEEFGKYNVDIYVNVEIGLTFTKSGDKLVPDVGRSRAEKYEMGIEIEYDVYDEDTEWYFPLSMKYQLKSEPGRVTRATSSLTMILSERLDSIPVAKAEKLRYINVDVGVSEVLRPIVLTGVADMFSLVLSLDENSAEVLSPRFRKFIRRVISVARAGVAGFVNTYRLRILD